MKLRDLIFSCTGLYISRTSPKPGPTHGPAASKPKLDPELPLGLAFGDLVAAALSFKTVPLRILQVGAYDGVSFDPIFDIVSKANVRRFLIEPNKSAAEKLRLAFSNTPEVTVIEAAIVDSDNTHQISLYKFSDKFVEIYPDFGGTSSISRRHLQDAFARNRHRFAPDEDLDANIIEDRVRALSSKKLLEEFGIDDIDVLVIDVEGADWIVLDGLLKAGLKPRLLLFESRFVSSSDMRAAVRGLHALGYIVKNLGYDTAAILNRPLAVRTGS